MTVREEAQAQAEEAYTKFLRLCKVGGIWIVVILISLTMVNFGDDGTGSKSDPALYEEYKERMLEMREEIKKKKYGG